MSRSASCRSWQVDRRPSGRVGRWGATHPSDLVRGGRSAPRGWIRKEPASPRQQPDLDSRSFSGWTEGCGFLPELCRASAARSRAPASRALGYGCQRAAPDAPGPRLGRPALAGLRAGGPPRRRAARGGRLRARRARAAPARAAWVPGLVFGVGFYFTHIVWMRAVGTDAWLALVRRRGPRSTALLGPVVGAAAPAPRLAAVGGGGLGGDGGDPQHLAVQRDALGAPRLRGRGHPGRGRAAVRRLHRRQLPARAGRGRCWPAWCWCAGGPGSGAAGALVGVAGAGRGAGPGAVQPRHAGARRRWRRCRATCPATATTSSTTSARSPRTTSRDRRPRRATWPPGGRPAPTSWSGRRTPRPSTRSSTRQTQAGRSGRRRAADRRADPGRRDRRRRPDHVLNQGIVWDPATGAGDRYTKWHPVPYGEYIPFRQPVRRQLRAARADLRATCWPAPAPSRCASAGSAVGRRDLLRRRLRRRALRPGLAAGAQLVTVQTSNATFIHTTQIEQQFAISRLRALETGRYVVVAATNGVSGHHRPGRHGAGPGRVRTRDVLVDRVGLVHGHHARRCGSAPGRDALCVLRHRSRRGAGRCRLS